MHCLCVVAVLMYVYVLSLCSGSHVYRQDVEVVFLAVSLVLGYINSAHNEHVVVF